MMRIAIALTAGVVGGEQGAQLAQGKSQDDGAYAEESTVTESQVMSIPADMDTMDWPNSTTYYLSWSIPSSTT